jgi:hypothetical protein
MRRVELLDQQLAASPYHHDTLQMPLSRAEKLVRSVKRKGQVVACAGAIFAHISAAPLKRKNPRQEGRL